MKPSQQTVGNIGLYYVCYHLSRLGWNVMPTARNARGVDIVGYSHDGSLKLTFQVKALSKRNAVGLGKHLDHLVADYVIVVRYVQRERPECFVLTASEAKRSASRHGQGEKASWWLEPPAYEVADFREDWDRLMLPNGGLIQD